MSSIFFASLLTIFLFPHTSWVYETTQWKGKRMCATFMMINSNVNVCGVFKGNNGFLKKQTSNFRLAQVNVIPLWANLPKMTFSGCFGLYKTSIKDRKCCFQTYQHTFSRALTDLYLASSIQHKYQKIHQKKDYTIQVSTISGLWIYRQIAGCSSHIIETEISAWANFVLLQYMLRTGQNRKWIHVSGCGLLNSSVMERSNLMKRYEETIDMPSRYEVTFPSSSKV